MLPEKPSQLQLDLQAGGIGAPPAQAAATVFRPIHYLGSKLRLAPAIADALDEADATRGTVLDLFAGSGTTALALAGHRSVIASDIQEYSRVICSALLTCRPPPADTIAAFEERMHTNLPIMEALRDAVAPLVDFEQEALQACSRGDADAICAVLEQGSIFATEQGRPAEGSPRLQRRLREVVSRMRRAGLSKSPLATAVRYFGGAYFSYAQAVELDALAAVAHGALPPGLGDVFTAALLSTASDTVNTVGKTFAQPIRPRNKQGMVKHHLLSKIYRDRQRDVKSAYLSWLKRYAVNPPPTHKHAVVRADYRDALKRFASQCAVVYADPPYTRDHYSRFYHVLETIALRDNPTIANGLKSGDAQLSRGLYRDDRHQSPFCIRSQASGAFRELFGLAAHGGAQMVLSYSPFESGAHPRLMQIDALLALAREFYSCVYLESVDGVSHSKLNHSSLNFDVPPEAEVIIVCKS